MFIQEIIIDGFKSYAHRTVVQGFDPHFNAITGLNGSGKSNILDAICFVLGITNLSQVRAGNLSELVYKQGQAGVNKAVVTIVFNNEDRESSPVGFEHSPQVTVTRQVLLGGKSKYLINGKNSPASAVQNLFHSVQLNVNNPHFLIMQGRITKVLNMKSHEILGMVEEAAGTRMYETKRVAALKTIAKKQAKLDELNAVLQEEITPTLEKLRSEKQNYLKWSKNTADQERLERFCIAHNFQSAQMALDENMEGVQQMEDQVETINGELEHCKEQIAQKDQEIADESSKIDGEMDKNLSVVKKQEQKYSKDLVRLTSVWKNNKENLGKAEEDLKAAKMVLEEAHNAVSTKQGEIAQDKESSKQTVEAAKAAENLHKKLADEYQTMSAGMSESTENRTLPEQISQALSDSKSAEAKIEQAKLKVKHLSKELKAVEKDIQKSSKSNSKLSKKKQSALSRVDELKEEINGLGFSSDQYESFESQKVELEASISELSERINTLEAQLNGRLSFEYSDPVRGFDRSKVKGLIARLIQVKDPKYSTALEVAAGGKLFQVVVDDAITSKALLDRGKLRKRVTIVPLDKIKANTLGNSVLKRSESIANSLNSNATPAIELVGFDEEVRSAIEYVFGSSIVVDGMKAANQICDATKTRTVTLEGDVYDPSGTISGGSKNNLGTTLARLLELAESTTKLEEQKKTLKEVSSKLKSLKATAASFDKLSSTLEVSMAEFDAAKLHLSQTNYGMLLEKKESFEAELKQAEEEITSMTEEKESKWELYESLKSQESVLTQQREERLSGIEQDLQDAKVKANELTALAREVDSKSQTLALELAALEQEVSAADEAVRFAQQAVEEAQSLESESQMAVGEIQSTYEEAREELEKLMKDIEVTNSKVSEMKQARAKLQKSMDNKTIEAKKLSIDINRIRKDRTSAEKTVATLLEKHAWIEAERDVFGVAGGDYDFEASNPKEVAAQLKALKTEQDGLAKRINKKVMGMIEKAESEYTELLRKRKVVENDKKKIQDVIKELDIKKKTELQMTWEKVNHDFGSVFSTLLPGTTAKLEPPEGMEVWEGLEVKVAFGGVWKESLTELSGGQRSLLALSLILALLLFKPAPMYILDEVDAALDLSHTQNIGNMLKTHFSQSQFIVVSLKEGMFNNANVIFRTKFVDGVSTVTRTVGTGSSRPMTTSNVDRGESTNDKVISRGRGRKRGKENF